MKTRPFRSLGIDPNHVAISVKAGVTLAAHGLSLPSLSFLSDATVSGAVATATHGTSPKWGTLSDFVRSMKLLYAIGVSSLG